MRAVGCALGLVLLGLVPCGAMAQTATASTATTEDAQSSSATTHGGMDLGRRVDVDTLSRLSGGTDVTETITINGTVSDNQVDHVVTGTNMIGGNALEGAAGVPMLIQNTGNGVLIQNATIINVQFKP